MQDFIQQAMSALGTSAPETKAAPGGLLGFLQDNGPKADVAQLLDGLPGARELIGNAAPVRGGGGGGGLLGGLGGAAAALGMGSGGAAGLLGAIQKSGLSLADAPKFISMFLAFARTKVSPDLVNRIAQAVPGLS
jgi:hypothetical protein